MSAEPGGPRIEGVLPYWLDRPDEEALQIADEVERAGLGRLWIGELATYDAVALATAIGGRTKRLALKLGPLAVGVRSPVTLALAVTSISRLTSSRVDLALGASSPVVVTGWHDRSWDHPAPRARETVEALRRILAGDPAWYEGEYVTVHGFRLRHPAPETRISLAAFGPVMTRTASRYADEVVQNLVPPQEVAEIRATVDAAANAARRTPPPLAVWVPVAVDPGKRTYAQLSGQLATYLAPPGYGEMFSRLGFGELVERARAGARRSELADRVPHELLQQVCALGSESEVAARLSAYHAAGADVIGVVPTTAEDPGGRRALAAAARSRAE